MVIQPEEGAPSVSLSVPEEELLEAVLTEEEIAAGAQVRITVAKAEPSTEELALFTNAMNGYKECLYLDISLAKVSGNAVTAITEVPGGIRLVLTLPTELQKEGRSFVLFREHDGSIEMLRDLDKDTATVTFESDKFSVFALAYSDAWQGYYPSTKPDSDVAQIGGSGDTTQTGNGNGDANPETGDNNNVGLGSRWPSWQPAG